MCESGILTEAQNQKLNNKTIAIINKASEPQHKYFAYEMKNLLKAAKVKIILRQLNSRNHYHEEDTKYEHKH